jgi:selenocysteine-specific elongation factor
LDPAEQRLVLGTAGHIDHGKTALIRALTGVDTDRLPEEKARGITIDLGFAPLDLEGGVRLGVVDVPGHERLVRTMVAGATGIDLLLLVVAADEGVMPQTREHVAICDLLGITRGVVALTKTDVAEEGLAELAAEEVASLLAETGLAGAEIVPVSAQTGEGLDALREALGRLAAGATPHTTRSGPPRLAIDRSFEVRGFGPVATGTLVGGSLHVGEMLQVHPDGPTGRLRGIQSHGVAAKRADPGVRCAVNLQGIPLAALTRGSVIAAPDALAPVYTLDAALHWLDVSPQSEGPTAVAFLTGTAERRARVAPIGAAHLTPGEPGFARIHVEGEAVAVLPGDRFVLRGFARTAMGGSTLGGGTVLDVAPPHRRRSDPALRRDLEALARRDPIADLRVRVERSGLGAVARDALRRETGLDMASFDAALASLVETGEICMTRDARCISRAAFEALGGRLTRALDAYHRAEPLRPGMPVAALRGTLPANVPRDAAELALARLAERGELLIEGDLARRGDHRATLGDEDRAAVERLCALLEKAGVEPPALRELCEQLSVGVDHLRDLLAHLERTGKLVRAPGDLWFDTAAIEALRERIRAHFRDHDALDTKDYKALIGTTRRTAVPLMELFDEERLTVRRGDVRRLRG